MIIGLNINIKTPINLITENVTTEDDNYTSNWTNNVELLILAVKFCALVGISNNKVKLKNSYDMIMHTTVYLQ